MRELRRAIRLIPASTILYTVGTCGMGMRPPYSEYAPTPIYIYPARTGPRPGVHFSRTELFQLLVAILALSGALTVAQIFGLGSRRVGLADLGFAGLVFIASFVAVASGVGLHEIAHKIVAQRYGNWAEFRYDLRGLALAFVFAMFGFIIAAPGATLVSGVVSREQNGRISAAGPISNLLIGTGFVLAATTISRTASLSDFVALFVTILFVNAWLINTVLAGFNMIPILPLDGAKVWAWNKFAWIGILVLVGALYLSGMFLGLTSL